MQPADPAIAAVAMSQKITAKNLSYSSSLPPFLAALRAQAGAAAAAAGPDPLLAGQRRSAKARAGGHEADDAPLVVDEHGNAVDVELDGTGAVKQPPPAAQPPLPPAGEPPADRADGREAEAKFAFGGRKRKAGRAVGAAAGSAGGDGAAKPEGAAADADAKHAREPATKARKKAKKIKLSFDDGENDG